MTSDQLQVLTNSTVLIKKTLLLQLFLKYFTAVYAPTARKKLNF